MDVVWKHSERGILERQTQAQRAGDQFLECLANLFYYGRPATLCMVFRLLKIESRSTEAGLLP